MSDRWWSWTSNTLAALVLLGLAAAPILPDLGMVLLAEIAGETADVAFADAAPVLPPEASALTTGSIENSGWR